MPVQRCARHGRPGLQRCGRSFGACTLLVSKLDQARIEKSQKPALPHTPAYSRILPPPSFGLPCKPTAARIFAMMKRAAATGVLRCRAVPTLCNRVLLVQAIAGNSGLASAGLQTSSSQPNKQLPLMPLLMYSTRLLRLRQFRPRFGVQMSSGFFRISCPALVSACGEAGGCTSTLLLPSWGKQCCNSIPFFV